MINVSRLLHSSVITHRVAGDCIQIQQLFDEDDSGLSINVKVVGSRGNTAHLKLELTL